MAQTCLKTLPRTRRLPPLRVGHLLPPAWFRVRVRVRVRVSVRVTSRVRVWVRVRVRVRVKVRVRLELTMGTASPCLQKKDIPSFCLFPSHTETQDAGPSSNIRTSSTSALQDAES